jgi:hypothetical protein
MYVSHAGERSLAFGGSAYVQRRRVRPGMTHAMEARLRVDPDAAFAANDFIVDSAMYVTEPIGGVCRFLCSDEGNRIYRLKAHPGYGDWFFPYVFVTDGGVGTCEVPADQHDGTIVATGAMNGCTLQVNRSHNRLIFYHDTNSVSMQGKLTPGEVVALVEPQQYGGRDDMGEHLAADYSRLHASSAAIFEHHILTIRVRGVWKIFCSSVLRIQFSDNKVKYRSFKPKPTKLVSLFAA